MYTLVNCTVLDSHVVKLQPLGRADLIVSNNKLLNGECTGQLQQMCPELIVEERDLSNNATIATRSSSQHGVSGVGARIESKFRPRLDS